MFAILSHGSIAKLAMPTTLDLNNLNKVLLKYELLF